MATVDKNFKIKNGLIVGDSTNLVNYTSSSPSDPFVGQLWISGSSLYAWSSASTWVLIGDGNTGGGGGSASGTPFNISNTLVARSASGTFSIGAIDLDTTASPALSVGRIQWNPNFGTPEVGLVGGNVTAHIGQHVHAYVTNAEGSPLVKGDVVYLFGSAGDRASVKKASNTSDTTSSKTLGVVAEAIGTGQNGFVTVFGVVDRLNLSAYSSGDILWLSASAGIFTNIKPSAPQHLVFVGVVARANAGNGELFVNVQNGYELEELHSVSITNLTDNDILSYNGSSSLWFNQNLATAIQEVDGAGSGIDADLLDSHQASYFINTSSATQEKFGTMTFHGTVNIEDLVITGSAVTISSTNLSLTDSLIQLAHEQYTTDAVDIGIIGSYGDGTTSSAAHYHTSFARDASQNKWKLLSKGPAPVNNVIDYSDPSVEFGILQVGSIEVSSSATVNNLNADLLDNQHGAYYLDWANTTNKPDPVIGVSLSGNTTAAASVTLTDLTNGQISLVTNTAHSTAASSMNWSGVTSKPSPVVGVNLTGNTTGAASATLTELANGQISITTNTAHAGTASSIAGSLVTGTVSNATHAATASSISGLSVTGPVASANFALYANSASSINWAGITGTPTTLLGYGITDGLRSSDAASAYIRVTSSAAIVSGYMSIGSTANHSNTASSIAGALVTGTVNNANHANTASSISGLLVTGPVASANFALFANTASSINWTGVTNAPDPIIGVNLVGEVTGAASATLTDLTNGQVSITTAIAPDSVILGTDTTGNYVAGATGGNGIVISGTAGEGWSPTITLHSSALTASVSGTSPTAADSNGFRNITISTSAATGGNDGDVWLVYV